MVTGREELRAEELEDRVIRIDRTRKTVAGGRLSSARVVMAVGDGKGKVGLGIGKARNVPEAISKGIRRAKKNMIQIPLDGYTIPHTIQAKVGGAVILLKPASRGTGIIAGGATRQLIEISGIRDILTKSLGSGNVMNRAKSCFKALSMLRDPYEIAEQRGTTVQEMLGREIASAYTEEAAEEQVEEAEEVVQVVKAEVEEAEEVVQVVKAEVEEVKEVVEVAEEEAEEAEDIVGAAEEPAEEAESVEPDEVVEESEVVVAAVEEDNGEAESELSEEDGDEQ